MAVYEAGGVFYEENCSSLTGWTDGSTGTGAVAQEDNAPGGDPVADTFKITSGGTAGAGNLGYCYRATGEDFEVAHLTIELSVYHDALGTYGNVDWWNIVFERSDWRFYALFGTDNLYIQDSAGVQSVGNWVIEDGWQTWIFDIDISGGVGIADCDVYLNSVLKASSQSCDKEGSYTNGKVSSVQRGDTNTNRTTYIDYIKIGTFISEKVLIGVNESAIVTESVAAAASDLQANTNESISVSEYVFAFQGGLSVNDDVKVTESINAHLVCNISVNESIAVTESISRRFYLILDETNYHEHYAQGDWDIVLEVEDPIVGNVDVSLPSLEISAGSGAAAAIELPSLTCSAEGYTENTGTAEISLPSLTMSAYSGAVSSLSVPSLTISATGIAGTVGSLDAELSALTIAATGLVDIPGSADLTLPKLTIAATGITGTVANLNSSLPHLTIAADGYAGEVGDVVVTLPALTIIASGGEDTSGDLSATIVALEMIAYGLEAGRFDNYILRYNRAA